MTIKTEPEERYHADKTKITSSMLKLMHEKSPSHVYAQFFDHNAPEKEESDALRLGSALHTACLEPELFDDKYVVIPEGLDRRTKEGKQLWSDLQASGKTVLKKPEFDMLKGVRAAALKSEFLKSVFASGNALIERTIESGDCKCRPDLHVPPCADFPNGLIVDLKSTTDASPRGFGRQAARLGYLIQDAHYRQVFAGVYKKIPEFVFLTVEKSYPYLVEAYETTPEQFEIGLKQRNDVLDLLRACMAEKKWPGYSDSGYSELMVPDWVYGEAEEDVTIITEDD